MLRIGSQLRCRRMVEGWRVGLSVLAVAGTLSLAGCADRNRDNRPDQAQTRVPGSAADRAEDAASRAAESVEKGVSKAAELGDNALTTAKIKNALLADRHVGAAGIDVDTKDDVVTLRGTVPTAAQKKRAEAIAKKHTGVRRVINKLAVQKA